MNRPGASTEIMYPIYTVGPLSTVTVKHGSVVYRPNGATVLTPAWIWAP